MNQYVIVSGLPASGKSTLALALARALALPLFDKDTFLEALFVDHSPSTPAERTELSRLADVALQEAVTCASGAVVASWWKHPRAGGESGTPVDWLRRLPGPLIEIYCQCPAPAAVERFTRRTRHPSHFDQRWSFAELLARFEATKALGPLGIGQVLEVETDRSVDIDVLAERVRLA